MTQPGTGIWHYQAALTRRLLAWSLVSISAGLAMQVGEAVTRAAGLQFISWGAIDAVIALFGQHQSQKRSAQPEAESVAAIAAETGKLRRLLWLNIALDVLYMAGGLLLIGRRGVNDLRWRGHGLGILIQGGFLFFFDLFHALPLRKNRPIGAQPVLPAPSDPMAAQASAFQGESHQPFQWEGARSGGDSGLTPAALLVHGFPGTPAEMRPLATTLHAAGWTVRGLLLPGFGSDIATLSQRSLSDWTVAIRQALGELQKAHHPVLVVGHSLGGALCIQAAASAPVDGLILLAPFWKLKGVIPAFWPLVRPFLRQLKPFRLFKPNFNDPKVRDGIREFLGDADLDDPNVRQAIVDFAIPVSLIDHLFSAGRAAYACAPQITAPVLVLQGLKDPLVHPVQTQRLSSRLAGRVSYHELHAAHDLPHPDLPAWPAVQGHVLAFVQGFADLGSQEAMWQAKSC